MVWGRQQLAVLGACVIGALSICSALAATAQAKKPPLITGPVTYSGSGGRTEVKLENGKYGGCEEQSMIGEVTGPTSGRATITNVGCGNPYGACTEPGKESGEITTEPLTTELGWIDKSRGEVGIDFKPASGLVVEEFTCAGFGFTFHLKGSFIAAVRSINVMSQSSSEQESSTGYSQDPEELEGGPVDTLRTVEGNNLSEEGVRTVVDAERITTNDEVEVSGKKGTTEKVQDPTEIGTQSGTPEYGRCQPHKKGKYADVNCTQRKEKKGKPDGKYEWEPV